MWHQFEIPTQGDEKTATQKITKTRRFKKTSSPHQHNEIPSLTDSKTSHKHQKLVKKLWKIKRTSKLGKVRDIPLRSVLWVEWQRRRGDERRRRRRRRVNEAAAMIAMRSGLCGSASARARAGDSRALWIRILRFLPLIFLIWERVRELQLRPRQAVAFAYAEGVASFSGFGPGPGRVRIQAQSPFTFVFLS